MLSLLSSQLGLSLFNRKQALQTGSVWFEKKWAFRRQGGKMKTASSFIMGHLGSSVFGS